MIVGRAAAAAEAADATRLNETIFPYNRSTLTRRLRPAYCLFIRPNGEHVRNQAEQMWPAKSRNEQTLMLINGAFLTFSTNASSICSSYLIALVIVCDCVRADDLSLCLCENRLKWPPVKYINPHLRLRPFRLQTCELITIPKTTTRAKFDLQNAARTHVIFMGRGYVAAERSMYINIYIYVYVCAHSTHTTFARCCASECNKNSQPVFLWAKLKTNNCPRRGTNERT